MKFMKIANCNLLLLLTLLGLALVDPLQASAQELMPGAQNGLTWRNLVIGTQDETTTRKTFYVEGMFNLSVFWSQHAQLKPEAVDYNDAFLGMNVGQVRDGLDSFYVDDRNLQVPIIDAVLIIRLQNAGVGKSNIDNVTKEFREATVNGMDPTRENKIWESATKLLR
ncbi:MAG TPA: hypothetical protein VIS48_03085 [Candidatus Kryptonia bacterium]